MNLAITLLVAVAIASIIGTVVQQGQPYNDYLLKFGPFWFEVFERLSLYDVYSAGWFLVILTFLVISTSVCLYRHTPVMWKEMTRFREQTREASLRVLRHKGEWSAADAKVAEAIVQSALSGNGYRFRRKGDDKTVVYGAMKGRWNRGGYIFTHLAIVVICVGGLIDGNLPLQWRAMTGSLEVETRAVRVSQIPPQSWLPDTNPSFRGSVTIPEGKRAGVVFLPLREGVVVQQLPFVIEVEQFRVEHYETGQPKSFESDLVIHDPELDEPLRQTIAVNHPLIHQGFAIYQSSFGDGGSELQLRAWPLRGGPDEKPQEFEGEVFQSQSLEIAGETRTLELEDFEVFNVRPDVVESGRRFRNVGPSVIYRLRLPTGEALQYENFMLPIQQDDRWYFLSGVRSAIAEEFQYLHIPADPNYRLDRFMNFLEALRDPQTVEQAALRTSEELLQSLAVADPELAPAVAHTATDMVRRLLEGGFGAVEQHVTERLQADAVEPARREVMQEFSRTVLQRTLARIYQDVVTEEAGEVSPISLDEWDQQFYVDALAAISALPEYGAPMFLEVTGFNHIQATGLQITRAPGQNVVYFGSALLMIGVFLMFYVPYRRVWTLVKRNDDGSAQVLLAGTAKRDPLGFEKDFARLKLELTQRLAKGSETANNTAGTRNGDT
ncbi:hypothetical protein CAI21_08225 [Alkalilimnicola ehrlichii]|nr:hypothetical protein CAI21_08225 [Alkalilimnicola ehrlichii]